MQFYLVLLFLLNPFQQNKAQNNTVVKGRILSYSSGKIIEKFAIEIEELGFKTNISESNFFEIQLDTIGDFTLKISAKTYNSKRVPITLEGETLNLGEIYLEKDISVDSENNIITIDDSELEDDEGQIISSGLLQSTKDIFLRRAAFDFGQAFFRVRGYDSNLSEVLINGISMNKFNDGRPQWNNWGGLNDVTRNQEFTNGLEASNYTFGGILGNTNIDIRPSKQRAGLRLSSSASNRTYAGRIMATYNSQPFNNGISYNFSVSRRWAKQGYISGTLYDAYSVFGSFEYKLNNKNSINISGIYANNRRGRSAAITQEVFNLTGNRYNPYWGNQNGDIRNSRERKIAEPIALISHFYEGDKFSLTTSLAYQFGETSKGRLGYFNAPNPDPTYYRYLPSFYLNSTIGANFTSANTAKNGFLQNPQIDWNSLYVANRGEKASYILQDDVIRDKQFSASTNAQINLGKRLGIDFGLNFKNLKSHNFARINDLLGASMLIDMDTFSNTRNDIDGELEKNENEVISYNYNILASSLGAFFQVKYGIKKVSGFLSFKYDETKYQREGLYRNERFLDNSVGYGEVLNFSNYGLKFGGKYEITPRHWVSTNLAYVTRAPLIQNSFINPRENNTVVPNVSNESISAAELNYFFRLPKLNGRLTAFYSKFNDATDINFFFVESGLGSDFVQEVLTNLDKEHNGIELGLEYELSSQVKLSGALNFGSYTYANNPNVTINFDTSGVGEDLINTTGNQNLGSANIKGYKLAQGPQKAISLGIEYRDPKYWWVSATANYLDDNYINISTITRTESFLLNPDTGEQFREATTENVSALLKQKPLESMYLLNLVGGKSWLVKGKYISAFISINNLFNTVYKTGGYEQSRNGNYEALSKDQLSGTPSFGPKYWFGFGRTYFLNFAISL